MKKVAHEVGKKLLCDVTIGINQVIGSGCVHGIRLLKKVYGWIFSVVCFLQALDYLENYVISRCHHDQSSISSRIWFLKKVID